MDFEKKLNEVLGASRDEASPSQAYRLYTDEPLGFAIGFMPDASAGVTADPIKLVSDDGGDNAFIIETPGEEEKLVISYKSIVAGVYSEPDAMIFRSKEKYDEWYRDYASGPETGDAKKSKKSKVTLALQEWGLGPTDISSLPGNQFHQLTHEIAKETNMDYSTVSEILSNMMEEHGD